MAFNKKQINGTTGRPGWFELTLKEQAEYNGKGKKKVIRFMLSITHFRFP